MVSAIVRFTEITVQEAPEFIYVFLSHYFGNQSKNKKLKAVRKSIAYDEVFSMIRDVFLRAVDRPLFFAQSISKPPMPVPPWAFLDVVDIPKEYIDLSGKALVHATGEEYAYKYMGGTEWFKKGLDYNPVRGEWISRRSRWTYASDTKTESGSTEEVPVMMYIHGGAFFFGSAKMYRFVLYHLLKSFTKGRVFSVDYRLAPQFPFPCPLVDALACYLYLIQPPPGAKHKAVSPSKIILAGDSAGGNAVINLLTIIRDAGLPMPGGGVMISPWCDLMHSMPSITTNSPTDILPEFGFVLPPSTLWPPPLEKSQLGISLHDMQGNNVTLKSQDRRQEDHSSVRLPLNDLVTNSKNQLKKSGVLRQSHKQTTFPDSPSENSNNNESEHYFKSANGEYASGSDINGSNQSNPTNGAGSSKGRVPQTAYNATNGKSAKFTDTRNPHKYPRFVLPNGDAYARIEDDGLIHGTIDNIYLQSYTQVHLYATNVQLQLPIVSPAWHGSLGGLPPLLINGGSGEMLQDEIILSAHRAANPDKYPVRNDILKFSHPKGKQHYAPTPVKLQVVDDGFHIMPLFFFLGAAQKPYKELGKFMDQVIAEDRAPPPLYNDPPEWWDSFYSGMPDLRRVRMQAEPMDRESNRRRYEKAKAHAKQYSNGSTSPYMIRERVAINGDIRALEPESKLPATSTPRYQWARLQRNPVRAWINELNHKEHMYEERAEYIERKREKYRQECLKDDARYGPLTPEYPSTERPSYSAIVGRDDNKESLEYRRMLRKNYKRY